MPRKHIITKFNITTCQTTEVTEVDQQFETTERTNAMQGNSFASEILVECITSFLMLI